MYIHIPKEKRTKMEPSGKKGTSVVYNETSKEFIIYVPSERHVEVSRDVNFHEEKTFKLSKELECDAETKEVEAPISEDHDDDFSPSDVQREIQQSMLRYLSLMNQLNWLMNLLQRGGHHGAEMY